MGQKGQLFSGQIQEMGEELFRRYKDKIKVFEMRIEMSVSLFVFPGICLSQTLKFSHPHCLFNMLKL